MLRDLPALQPTAPTLGAVRARRARLIKATDLVEEALITHAEETIAWRSSVRDAIASLVRAWDLHSQGSEQPDGLLAQLQLDVPNLAPKVERMRREHRQVAASLRDTLTLTNDPNAPRDDVQDAVAACLILVETHRRHGGALVDEAYRVDIGGGG
jgi:hypothetical protein